MVRNNEFKKKNDTKNHECCYFDLIININDLNLDYVYLALHLSDEKYERIYNIIRHLLIFTSNICKYIHTYIYIYIYIYIYVYICIYYIIYIC